MSSGEEVALDRAGWWFVVWLSVAQLVSWGTLYYGFSVLFLPMQGELGWSKTTITAAFSIGLLVAGIAAIPVGAWIDRHGARGLMVNGSVLASALMFAWSTVRDPLAFLAIWVGLGLAISATLYEPAFAVLNARFGRNARRAITTLTLLGGLASTVFIPLTQLLVDTIGWRRALWVLAACNLLISAAIHFAILRRRHPAADAAPEPAASFNPLTALARSPAFRAVVRTRTFWALFACYIFANLATSAVSAHFVPMLAERGASTAYIVTLAALIGPSQVLARLGTLGGDKWLTARRLGRAATFLLVASLFVAWAAPAASLWVLLFPVLFGLGNGTMTIVRGTAVPELLTRRDYGTISGALGMSTMVARAGAPVGASIVWGLAGGYDGVIVVTFALALAAAAAYWVASLGRPLED